MIMKFERTIIEDCEIDIPFNVKSNEDINNSCIYADINGEWVSCERVITPQFNINEM